MKKPPNVPSRVRRIAEFILVMVLIYAGLLVFFRFSPEKNQWLTDSWKVSSKEDAWIYPLTLVVQGVLVLGGCFVGLWLALRMLVSENRRYWFGGFFVLLGSAGITLWSMVSTVEEKAATAHIPYIGGGFIVLGIVFVLFFKPKKRSGSR